MRALKGLLLIIVLSAIAASPVAKGEVLFSVSLSGNDVIMNITTPLIFTINQNYSGGSGDYVGAILGGSSYPSSGPAVWDFTPTPLIPIGGSALSKFSFGNDISFGSFAYGIYLRMEYSSAFSLTTSQTYTIPAGIYVMPDWYYWTGQLPSNPTQAQLFRGTDGAYISNAISAVPEPSSITLLGLATIGGYLIRRKRA